jgi:hypothetical protein
MDQLSTSQQIRITTVLIFRGHKNRNHIDSARRAALRSQLPAYKYQAKMTRRGDERRLVPGKKKKEENGANQHDARRRNARPEFATTRTSRRHGTEIGGTTLAPGGGEGQHHPPNPSIHIHLHVHRPWRHPSTRTLSREGARREAMEAPWVIVNGENQGLIFLLHLSLFFSKTRTHAYGCTVTLGAGVR